MMVLAFRVRRLTICVAFVLSFIGSPGAVAQITSKSAKQGSVASAEALQVPSGIRQSLLIRATLLAVAQANATGNYSVLRDLGVPSFQMANTSARLAEVFATLRRRKLDLTPVLFYEPKLVRSPAIDENRRLRLTGFIDSRPEQVRFDMLFESLAGQWRLFGLAVDMRPAPTTTAQASTEGKQRPAAAKPQSVGPKSAASKSPKTTRRTPNDWVTDTRDVATP